MATNCIVIGEKPEEIEKKPIQFIKSLITNISESSLIENDYNKPEQYQNVELIRKSVNGRYDIMFAYNNNRRMGGIYLGFWNDGVV